MFNNDETQKRKKDMRLFLKWAGEQDISFYPDASDYLVETEGQIWIEDINTNIENKIGEFRVFFCDLEEAINAGISAYDVFDENSRVFDFHKALFKRDDFCFSPKVVKTIHDTPFNWNVLIIDRIEIQSPFRGNGYGLQVMLSLMKRFGSNAGLVAINPFPLQFEGTMPCIGVDGTTNADLKKWEKELDKSTKKLSSYYEFLQFSCLPRTPYMVRSLELILPNSATLESIYANRVRGSN
jgi:hypothetical protein